MHCCWHLQMDFSQPCLRAVTRMSWCPYCRGFTHLKPCSNYCLNVMKGCLAYHYELNDAWNAYIGEDQLLFLGHYKRQARFLEVKFSHPLTVTEAFLYVCRLEEIYHLVYLAPCSSGWDHISPSASYVWFMGPLGPPWSRPPLASRKALCWPLFFS